MNNLCDSVRRRRRARSGGVDSDISTSIRVAATDTDLPGYRLPADNSRGDGTSPVRARVLRTQDWKQNQLVMCEYSISNMLI